MSGKQMTFREWIKATGVGRMAGIIGYPEATIYSWSRRGDIPQGAWVDIVFKFAEIGLSDLKAMHAASEADRIAYARTEALNK